MPLLAPAPGAPGAAREQALYRQANYDALTGLINRQAFSDRLADLGVSGEG